MTEPLPLPIRSDPNTGFLRWVLHASYGALWWLVIGFGSLWSLPRFRRDPDFREMVRRRMGVGLPEPPQPGERQRILIHGVSVGEIKAARSLVLALEQDRPDLEIVLSSVTSTGFNIAQELYPHLRVVRFPFDPGWIVARFLRRVAPVTVVLVELEIWPNFLRAANRAGIPVAVVNGRIAERSFRSYRIFRNLLPQFNRISLYCVQAGEYGERFAQLAYQEGRILLTGNMKADSLGDGRVDPGEEFRRLLGGNPGQLVLTAGSTHGDEEQVLARLWSEAWPETRLILVPRHPNRAGEVRSALEGLGLQCQFLTELRAGLAPDPSLPVIVDRIGDLEPTFGLSDLVFIGGTLVPHGGQNMLEPAAQGLPVIYGPHVDNFLVEARLLEEAGAALRVATPAELQKVLSELIKSPERREIMAKAGLEVVRNQKGATLRTMKALRERCIPAQEK